MDKGLYNKIHNSSNWYYNRGLMRAKLRDLSGAIEDLQASIKYNKKNIQARNLLGLVYYEKGEVCQALCHWTISSSFQPLGNRAKEYLEAVKSDEAGVENVNSMVRKYNQALIHARHSSDDLAIIQLKQVIEMAPDHINAYLLLALLFMRGGQYNQAYRALRVVLRKDVNNLDALRYMEEVRQQLKDRGRRKTRQESQEEKSSRNQSRFSFTEEEEEAYNRRNYLYMVLGLGIGVLFMAALVLPNARREAVEADGKSSSMYQQQTEILEGRIADLQKENTKQKQELDQYAAVPEDYFENAASALFEEGYGMYEEGAYSDALERFTRAYQLNPENGRALFFMGKMNHLLENYEETEKYFAQVIEQFPGTEQSEEAQRLLNEMDES